MLAGIVDVGDLAHRGRQLEHFLAVCRLPAEPGPSRHGFVPPRVLVVLTSGRDLTALLDRRAWLADCAHLVVVRRLRADQHGPNEGAVRAVLPSGVPADVFTWPGGDAPVCRAALDRAIRIAAERPDEPELSRAPASDVSLPPGPWIDAVPTEPRLLARALAGALAGTTLRTPEGEVDLTALPWRIELPEPRRTPYPLGHDPVHPVSWHGTPAGWEVSYVGRHGTCELTTLAYHAAGPADVRPSDAVDVALSPDGDLAIARSELTAVVIGETPLRWRTRRRDDGAGVWVATRDHDPVDATLFAAPPGPTAMLAGMRRYAVDLSREVGFVQRRTRMLDVVIAGFGVFDHRHELVREARGKLLGGWHRHATIWHRGALWREDLVDGTRQLLAPADFRVCVDPAIEAIARDAMREGRFDRAKQIRTDNPSEDAGGPVVIGVPGTRNVLYVARGKFRLI